MVENKLNGFTDSGVSIIINFSISPSMQKVGGKFALDQLKL